MILRRTFLLLLAFSGLPLGPAAVQLAGVPGTPGIGSPSQQPPPACMQLMTARDETQKHGQALSAVGRKKAPPEEICKLFKVFLAAETTMVNGLEEYSATCGVPANVIEQVKAQHGKASRMAEQVCDVAERRGVPLRFDAPAPRFDASAPLCTEKTLTPGVPCV